MAESVHSTGIGSEYWFGARGGACITLRPSRPAAFRCATLVCSGRSAIAVAARHALRTKPAGRKRFLLPSYLCHTVIQPFLELGAQVAFYDVGDDLSSRPERIEERISADTAGVLLTTYFGFPRPGNVARVLKDRYPDIEIIDDRTHNLLSDLAQPNEGDESATIVYSVRKWGPFPDLGLVRWPSTCRKPLAPPDKRWDGRFFGVRATGLVLRSAFAAYPCETLRRLSLGWIHRADEILDRRVMLRNASPASTLLWRVWDWQRALTRRRANFEYLLKHWPEGAGAPLYRRLPDGVGPLGFPIRTPDRDGLRQHFILSGIFAPVHWNNPEQVDAMRFAGSARLAREELTIPIDQRYERDDMDRIVEAANAWCYHSGSSRLAGSCEESDGLDRSNSHSVGPVTSTHRRCLSDSD